MKRAAVPSILVGVVMLAVAVIGEAQQPKKVPRIGYLGVNPRSTSPARIDAFRQGLRELGYTEGKNIIIEWRYAEEKLDRLPALAAATSSLDHSIRSHHHIGRNREANL